MKKPKISNQIRALSARALLGCAVLLGSAAALSCSADPPTPTTGDDGANAEGGAESAAHDCSDGTVTCTGHATCVADGSRHRCACNDGFTGDGTLSCEAVTVVQDCHAGSVVCTEHASCSPKGSGYECLCDDGYEGDGEVSCKPTPDCHNGGVTCAEHASCAASGDTYRCSCDDGYQGNGTASCKQKPVCTTNQKQACTCLNTQTGSQTCDATGLAWGSCTCPKTKPWQPCALDEDCPTNYYCGDTEDAKIKRCFPPVCSSQIGETPCPALIVTGIKISCDYVDPCAGSNETCADGASFCQMHCKDGAKCPYGMTCNDGLCGD